MRVTQRGAAPCRDEPLDVQGLQLAVRVSTALSAQSPFQWDALDSLLPPLSPVAYSRFSMMEIEHLLRTAPARVAFVLPQLLEFMFKSMQEYAFGLILGALNRKIWLLWEIPCLECDVDLFASDLELPPSFGVPLMDYA